MSEPPTPPDLPPTDELGATPVDPPGEAPPPPPPIDAPPPPPAAGSGGGGVESPNRGLMIVLSYLWLLALIPLLTEKEDQEVQWHAKHGLVLAAAGIAVMLLLSFLTTIPGLGCIAVLLMPLAFIGIAIVHIVAILKGLNGTRFIIPQVSQYADKF